MGRSYVTMTPAELSAALARPGQIVLFAARLSAVARLPKTAEDVRMPSVMTPVTSGMVVGMIGDRARIDGGHGECGTIAVDDATYLEDQL
jgi:hypothetical protein